INYDAGRVRPETLLRTLNDLGFAPRETDHDDMFAEEEQDLRNAKRIALIAGGLVSLASVLMILRVWLGASPIFVFGQAILSVLRFLQFLSLFDLRRTSSVMHAIPSAADSLSWTVFPHKQQ